MADNAALTAFVSDVPALLQSIVKVTVLFVGVIGNVVAVKLQPLDEPGVVFGAAPGRAMLVVCPAAAAATAAVP